MITKLVKHLYLTAGWICLVVGSVGIFLPLLPTTPFVLLAALCFSKGSDTLHRWLLRQKTFGPIIRDWNQYGVIRLGAKWTSTCLIIPMLSYPVLFGNLPLVAKITAVLVGIGVIGFIWSRPAQVP